MTLVIPYLMVGCGLLLILWGCSQPPSGYA